MNRIHPDLWISDLETVRSTSFEADQVVSVCQDSVAENVGCSYQHFNMADGEEDEWGGNNDYELFADAVNDVISAVENGDDVVVHCHMGRSRSAAVCIAALGALDSVPYSEAYRLVNNARRIDPDPLLVEHANRYLWRNQ